MTNDVRLLLEDVSRLHARLSFDENGFASLEVLGTNGLWHNDKFIQPDSPPTPWPLSEGDVLRISRHKISFSYASAAKKEKNVGIPETQQVAPEPKDQPSLISSTPRPDGKTAKQATPTPTRRSARLKARASMPSLRHGWTPEKELRPVPLTQLTTSAQHRLDLASPSVGRPKLCQQEETLPEESAKDIVENHGYSPLKEEAPDSHDTHSPSSSVSPTKQDDLSQEMELTVMDSTCREDEQDDVDETVSMESMGLDRMEVALSESKLINEPASSLSPASAGPRYPMAVRQPSATASPLVWSPSKSRKVSLRTATLLKRSAQLPILPIPETTRRVPSPVRFAEPASSGSTDMDISSTLPLQESSSDDDESEVEQSLELQIHQEAQAEPQNTTGTPHQVYAKPRPLSQTFLTPQVEKAQNPTHRRLSFEPHRSSANVSTPGLKHKSSWQWLKGILSPGKQDSETADQVSVTKPKPEPGALDELPVITTHEEGCQDAGRVQLSETSDEDEFFDTDDEMPHKNDDADATIARNDGSPPPSSPLSHPKEPAGSHALDTPSTLRATDALPTPDMHVLKHMFAEPKPTMTAESAMADFRHLVYKDERNAGTASDMSLGDPFAALEMDAQGGIVAPIQSATDQIDKDEPRAWAMSNASPSLPVPLDRKVIQHKSNKDSARVSTEFRPMAERPVRSMTRKEPYVPVRRQLPQRNSVKTSRIGSLSTTATRISAGAAGDSKENQRKMDVPAPALPGRPARPTADGIKITSIPVAKPAGTKNSSTTLTHQYRRPTRAMESRTNLHSQDKRTR